MQQFFLSTFLTFSIFNSSAYDWDFDYQEPIEEGYELVVYEYGTEEVYWEDAAGCLMTVTYLHSQECYLEGDRVITRTFED